MGTDAQRISTEPDRLAAVNISQAFRVGDLVFVSGQAAVNDQGEVVGVGDFGSLSRRRAVADHSGISILVLTI